MRICTALTCTVLGLWWYIQIPWRDKVVTCRGGWHTLCLVFGLWACRPKWLVLFGSAPLVACTGKQQAMAGRLSPGLPSTDPAAGDRTPDA